MTAVQNLKNAVVDNVNQWESRALELLNHGSLVEALRHADEGIAEGCETAALQNLRGNILDRMGLTAQSVTAYERAAFLNPNSAIARCNLGLAHQKAGAIDQAIACWEELISSIPSFTDAYIALALARMDRREFKEAEILLRRVLEIDSSCASAHLNLGLVLQRTERLDEAADYYRKALQLDSSLARAHVNLGSLYHRWRLSIKACKHFRQALDLDPALTVARYNLGQELLLRGDLRNGWPLYEARLPWLEERGARPMNFNEPRWYGGDPEGMTIMLVAEQGLGDTIQFIRYARPLAERGAQVLLEAQPELCRLLQTAHGVSEVFPQGTLLPRFDVFCPLMSLPLAFRTTLASVPNGVPYVRADPHLVTNWKHRLGSRAGLWIGLCWAGNPRRFDHDLAQTDRRRSIPPTTLLPLFDVPGTRFYSLQKDVAGSGSTADARSLTEIVAYPSDLVDFADTAAYVENLDLVITVDTSVAHLAGALGKPVWVLSRFDGCWRWLLHGEHSPWYPSARIWRQEARGDWANVIRQVRDALMRLTCVEPVPTADIKSKVGGTLTRET